MMFASSGLCRKRFSGCTFCGFFVASQVKSIQGQNMLNGFFFPRQYYRDIGTRQRDDHPSFSTFIMDNHNSYIQRICTSFISGIEYYF